MNKDQDILQELRDLNSSIAGLKNAAPFSVPEGYFEKLSANVLNKIRVNEELEELSPTVLEISREKIYTVPTGYFENLSANVLNKIRVIEELEELSPKLLEISQEKTYTVPTGYFETLSDRVIGLINREEISVEEELQELSPLLATASKKSPYTIPGGYFDRIEIPIEEKKEVARVIPITKRSWFRYAAAAVITAFIVSLGFMILGNNEIDPDVRPTAWVEKKLQKVSTDDIDEFVELVDDNVASANAPTPAEIKLLVQEVSPDDIESFLDEAALAEPGVENEILN